MGGGGLGTTTGIAFHKLRKLVARAAANQPPLPPARLLPLSQREDRSASPERLRARDPVPGRVNRMAKTVPSFARSVPGSAAGRATKRREIE